ncbi:hypothetical protein LOTGIDRAFT_233764, partial [Lottia gigantea]
MEELTKPVNEDILQPNITTDNIELIGINNLKGLINKPVNEGVPMFTNDNDELNEIRDYDDDDDDDDELGFDFEEEEEDSIISEPVYPITEEEKITWHEQIRMIHLRSHINELDEKVKSCTYETEKTREELKQCRNQINLIERKRDETFIQIETAETDDNIAAVYRLKSAHDKLVKELESEEELEEKIAARLEETEYELWKAEVEKGKFLLAENELKYKEQLLVREKTNHALNRLTKEEKLAKI